MKTLAACLIVKDEELVIERCINSLLDICDEINVVDTGSTDKTLSILNELSEKYPKIKLYNFVWVKDFSSARNFSFSKATCDYVMWIDSDEFFTDELNKEILRLKEKDFNNEDVISIMISNYNGTTFESAYHRDRIINNANKSYWRFKIHEEFVTNQTKPTYYIKPNLYVGHQKHKQANFCSYFHTYYDIFNKGQMEDAHHNWFYYTWTTSFYDKSQVKLHLYDLYTCLSENKMHSQDYRYYWLEHNLINQKEFEILQLISMLPKDDANIFFLYAKVGNLYFVNEKFCVYYICKYIEDNRPDLICKLDKFYNFYNITLYDLGLIKHYIENCKKHYCLVSELGISEEDSSYKIALQNFNFSLQIQSRLNNFELILDFRHNKNILPFLLFIARDVFNKVYIVNESNEDIDEFIKDYTNKENIKVIGKDDVDNIYKENVQYLVFDERFYTITDKFNRDIKRHMKGHTDFEWDNCVYTKNLNDIKEYLDRRW